jgi:hypothetical protein
MAMPFIEGASSSLLSKWQQDCSHWIRIPAYRSVDVEFNRALNGHLQGSRNGEVEVGGMVLPFCDTK